MRRPARLLAALALSAAALALTPPVPAAGTDASGDRQTARSAPADREIVQRVERYLSDIDTMHAEFIQSSSNGAMAEGEVWLDRPGKLRFEYAPPHPTLMVSNGTLLLYYDRELEQTSYVPVSETPLWFLIRDKIDIEDIENYELAGIQAEKGAIRVQIVQEGGSPDKPGSLTLVFQDDPLALRRWRIVDQQGITTEVSLINPEYGVKVDQDLFDFGELDLPEGGRPSKGK